MESAHLNVTKAFSNGADLIEYAKRKAIGYGIQFPDSWWDIRTLPDKFTFIIRSSYPFQAKLRFGTEDFPPYAFPPGFLKIQNALSLQYIRAKAKERKLETDFEVPTFKVLPVPVTEDVGSKSTVAFMLVMLSLVFLTARLVEVWRCCLMISWQTGLLIILA